MKITTDGSMAKQRISISLDEDVLKWLSIRAEKEVRSISNLVEFFVVREMQNDQSQKKK